MSGHSVSAIALFISVAAIALAASHTENQEASLRNPAMAHKEMTITDSFSGASAKHTEKIHGPTSTRIEMIGTAPEKSGDVFVLKGVVESNEQVNDLEYVWAIAPGLEIVNGLKQGSISLVKAGQPAELQITLRSLTGENRQVHLIVKGQQGSTRFGESAQYNTVVQSMLDADKEAVQKANEKALEEHGDSNSRKVYQ